MPNWSHTDSNHGSLSYQWKSQGRGKPRRAVILGHIAITEHNWEHVTIEEFLAKWEENKDRFIGTPHLTIDMDYYNYGDDDQKIVISGEYYADEKQTDQIKTYEASVRAHNKLIADRKREQEREEYERLKKIFEKEN